MVWAPHLLSNTPVAELAIISDREFRHIFEPR